jgi:hypothetical protein
MFKLPPALAGGKLTARKASAENKKEKFLIASASLAKAIRNFSFYSFG